MLLMFHLWKLLMIRREVINSFHPQDHEIVPVPGLVAVCAGRGPVSGFDSGLRAMR